MTEHEARGVSGSTSLELGARDETWDVGEAKKSLQTADYPKAAFYRDPAGDASTLAAYKLWFAERDDSGLHAVWHAVTAAAQRLSSLKPALSDADEKAVKARIGAYYAKAKKKYADDTIEVPWASGSSRANSGTVCDNCDHDASSHADTTAGDDMGACGEDDCDCPAMAVYDTNTRDAGSLLDEIRFVVAPLTHIDVRDPSSNDDGTWTMSGYAAVFNQQTTLYNGRFIKVTETIDPGAFDRVLREQPLGSPEGVVHLTIGHDMNRAIAATDVANGQPGSLSLRVDSNGQAFLAKVPKDDPDGVAAAVKLRTGVWKQASFMFTVNQATWTDTENADGPDESHRRITEIGHLYDNCVCAQGAYPQTVSQLRMMAAALGQPTLELERGGRPRQPAPGGENPVSPSKSGGGAASRRLPASVIRGLAAHTPSR